MRENEKLRELDPLPSSLDQIVDRSQMSRRTLLRGLSIFLGASLIPALEACTPTGANLPKGLSNHSDEMNLFQEIWAPPKAVTELGREVISVNGDMPQRIETLLKALSSKVSLSSAKPIELARALKDLHIESAKHGSWVEVRGWRLSSVEAAAYALSSFDLS